jgi:hypothetical protein
VTAKDSHHSSSSPTTSTPIFKPTGTLKMANESNISLLSKALKEQGRAEKETKQEDQQQNPGGTQDDIESDATPQVPALIITPETTPTGEERGHDQVAGQKPSPEAQPGGAYGGSVNVEHSPPIDIPAKKKDRPEIPKDQEKHQASWSDW